MLTILSSHTLPLKFQYSLTQTAYIQSKAALSNRNFTLSTYLHTCFILYTICFQRGLQHTDSRMIKINKKNPARNKNQSKSDVSAFKWWHFITSLLSVFTTLQKHNRERVVHRQFIPTQLWDPFIPLVVEHTSSLLSMVSSDTQLQLRESGLRGVQAQCNVGFPK